MQSRNGEYQITSDIDVLPMLSSTFSFTCAENRMTLV